MPLGRVAAQTPAAGSVHSGPSQSKPRKTAPQLNSTGSGVNDNDDIEGLLAELPGVIYECDEHLTLLKISPNSLQVLGLEVDAMAGDKTLWHKQLFANDHESVVALIDTLSPGQTVSTRHRMLDRRGLPQWVYHSVRMTATKTGTLLRGFIVPIPKEDCTQDLDSSLIPQFVHKIGNHFQLINLLVGNLRRNGVPEAEIDTLQRALDETVEFTRTFLDYSQRPSCMSEFDLGEILLGQMQTMQHAFVEKGITLDNRLDDCFNGALVLGDPALLESALGAVLQNALDATPANGTVTLSGNCGQDRGDSQCSAHVVIADTGCGIEEDLLTRAIEPFYTSRRDRSGLGLSGAFRIAEQHGGRLWICSVAGQGTQVHIMLPIVRTSQTPDR